MGRPLRPIALAFAALIAVLTVTASPASAATGHYSATFSVLHDDRIGALKVPAGEYDVTLINPPPTTCARTSRLLAKFLQDFDGTLPPGWRLIPRKAKFINRGGFGFKIAPSSSGGGGGGQHPGGVHQTCPTFRVLGDDQIAGFSFPKGTYQMTALGGLACPQASNLFRRFLQSAQTGRWRLDPTTGTFSRRGSDLPLPGKSLALVRGRRPTARAARATRARRRGARTPAPARAA